MDWLQLMNNAMEYIESHLTEEIDLNQAARVACCSTYHFQRMFSFITGVPLSEYIRRRRLTLAAFDLQQSHAKVIDTALKHGYESPEAFSRAFKKMHGVMPTSAREKGIALKAYPRLSFHISIRGDVEMNYRIEEKPAFEMFGVTDVVNTEEARRLVIESRTSECHCVLLSFYSYFIAPRYNSPSIFESN
ncbi:AraC-type DNA-binding protein [Paenibacillus sp. 453mf]|nr:AraC-type DNA-binding protein [Paenibacillus sp. 453mf]